MVIIYTILFTYIIDSVINNKNKQIEKEIKLNEVKETEKKVSKPKKTVKKSTEKQAVKKPRTTRATKTNKKEIS